MSLKQIGSRYLALILSALLCNVPQYVAAQAATSTARAAQSSQEQSSQNTDSNAQQKETPSADQQNGPTRFDPAQAPLAPVPSARPSETSTVPPDAPSEVQRTQQTQSTASNPQPSPAQPQRQNPLGTATAQQGATRGGVASRPAGEAIAPAKQRQVHSLLIKLGLVAAGAAAVGTVVGLTRGTSSVPPGAR
jgi:flagellum-specific peptidoglycan hydrolase FlgJ